MGDDTPETTELKASLATLAKTDEAAIIEQAVAATEDLAAAAEFVESVGLDRLELAVGAVDDPDIESQGRAAVETFYRFRNAAAGPNEPNDSDGPPFQFHRGRGTHINDDGERPAE
jgi:hypothetical protein